MVGIRDFDMPNCCNTCEHWSFNRDDEPLCDLTYEYISQFNKRQDDCPLVEVIPKADIQKALKEGSKDISENVLAIVREEYISKADYENRLKADMVAMLEELKKEIEEIKPLEPTDDEDWQYGCFHGLELMQDKCLRLIQQKINSLKEA